MRSNNSAISNDHAQPYLPKPPIFFILHCLSHLCLSYLHHRWRETSNLAHRLIISNASSPSLWMTSRPEQRGQHRVIFVKLWSSCPIFGTREASTQIW